MNKSPDAFRTISEVAEVLDTPAHVLRFWESRFPQIRPVKRAGGRRYYRPSDVALLSGIKRLLHDEGLTIRGVQKILRDQGARHVAGLSDETTPLAQDDTTLTEAVADDQPVEGDDLQVGPPAPPATVAAAPTAAPAQPPLPLFDAAEARAATPPASAPAPARPPRDDRTLASLLRSLPKGHRLADPAGAARLARRLAALRDRLAARAEGGAE
jgi:DNA-binding transcriptional MerR regulator